MHDGFPEHVQKQCRELLTKLAKKKAASAFLQPVDYKALGLDDYPDIIKHPMDISTIRQKFNKKEYKNKYEFRDDFKLMVQNCKTYNPPENYVHKAAVELEVAFDALWPHIKEQEVKVEEKVKKPKVNQDDYTKMKSIVDELSRSKHHNIMWPFMDPITDETVPGYTQIIKNPTYFKKISQKVKDKQFDTFNDFVKELKLMTENCFKFNADVKKIYDCGLDVELLVQTLISKEKGEKADILKKTSDLRKTIENAEREIALLEETSDLKTKKRYTIEEKLQLADVVSKLNVLQMTRIAQILSKTGVPIETGAKSEIEVNVRQIPDVAFAEIEAYLKVVESAKSKNL